MFTMKRPALGLIGLFASLALFASASPVAGQVTFQLFGPPGCFEGGLGSADVEFNNFAAISGWSFGICQDNIEIQDFLLDDPILNVNNGNGPDFLETVILPGPGGGLTNAVVLSSIGNEVLSSNFVVEVFYETTGPVGGTASLSFCDTLGNPPVLTTAIDPGGNILTPTFFNFNCGIDVLPEPFIYRMGFGNVEYNPATGAFLTPSLEDVAFSMVQSDFTQGLLEVVGVVVSNRCDTSVLSPVDVSLSPILQALNGGNGPDFFDSFIFPDSWTAFIVPTSFGAPLQLPGEIPLLEVDYEFNPAGNPALIGNTTGVTIDLEFVDISLPISAPNVVVLDSGAAIPSILENGAVDLIPLGGVNALTLSMQDTGPNQIEVILDSVPVTDEVSGWSYGICHDSAELVCELVESGSTANMVNGGQGLDFFQPLIFPEGHTVGVIVNFLQTSFLTADNAVIGRAEYSVVGSPGATSPLIFCETLSTPPVGIDIVVGTNAVNPATQDFDLPLGGALPEFRLGDCNANGALNIVDPIFMLRSMVVGGAPQPDCPAACDLDSSGSIDMADAINLFTILFQFTIPPVVTDPLFPVCTTRSGVTLPQCQFAGCP